jgi:hypothetical protein
VQRLRSNFEEEYLKTLASPGAALAVLLSATILTQHEENEVYLSSDRHDWIRVSPLVWGRDAGVTP